MKRPAAVALLMALSASAAAADLNRDGNTARPLTLRAPAATSPLLGIRYRGSDAWLIRVDSRTLLAPSRPRLPLGEFIGSWSFSPDRRLLALGNHSSSLTWTEARVRFVAARTLRPVRSVALGVDAEVPATHWAAPDRLLAIARSIERDPADESSIVVTDRLLAVDPARETVVARHELPGTVTAIGRMPGALVLLLQRERWGPVRLAVVQGDGAIRSVVVDRVEAGTREMPNGFPRHDAAAVAVDRDAGRAYVIAAGSPVAEVDLGTLAVVYHTPVRPVSLLGRLHDWLEPRAIAKEPLEGSWRTAIWLGDGRFAVVGHDTSTYSVGSELATREQPSGFVLIDTRTWSERLVDGRASELAIANGAVVSWGTSWDSGRQLLSGNGMSVYDRTGALRSHLFGPRAIFDVQVVGQRAFVRKNTSDSRYAIVDLRAGRQVRVIRGREMPLVLSGEGATFLG